MTLRLNGSTSGYTEIDAPAVAGSNTIVLPSGNGSANQLLKNGSTAGSLEFSSSVYIDSSQRLLIGTSTARNIQGHDAKFQTEGVGYNNSTIQVIGNDNSVNGAYLFIGKTRGTSLGSNTVVQNGDDLGEIRFYGADGTGMIPGARIQAQVDSTPGTNDMPGRLVFSTTSDGASSPTSRVILSAGGDFFPNTDNASALGKSGQRWQVVWAANGTIQTSDARTKTEVSTSTLGTDFVKSLRPVSYKWIEGGKRETLERDENNEAIFESVPGQRTHWGFIAQEVKEAVDAAGVDFGGWVLTDKDDPDSQQALRYDQFIAPLTKALQEALAKIEILETRIAALEVTP